MFNDLLATYTEHLKQCNGLRRAANNYQHSKTGQIVDELIKALTLVDPYLVPAQPGRQYTMQPELVDVGPYKTLTDLALFVTTLSNTITEEHTISVVSGTISVWRKNGRLETQTEADIRYKTDLLNLCNKTVSEMSKDGKRLLAQLDEAAKDKIIEMGLEEIIAEDLLHADLRQIVCRKGTSWQTSTKYTDARSFALAIAKLDLTHDIDIEVIKGKQHYTIRYNATDDTWLTKQESK